MPIEEFPDEGPTAIAEFPDVEEFDDDSPSTIEEFEDEPTSAAQGIADSFRRGMLSGQRAIEATQLSTDQGGPTVGQGFRAFNRSMADPRYSFGVTGAQTEAERQRMEAMLGPSAVLERMRGPIEERRTATAGEIARLSGEIGKIRQTKAMEEWDAANNSNWYQVFARHPLEITANIFAESLPQASAGIAAGMAGGVTAGPAGAAAGMASGSFAVEAANALLENAQKVGVNLEDPEQVRAFFEDPEKLAAAKEFAVKRGLPIAMFDGLTAGMAGKMLRPALGKGVGRVAAASAGEAGLQMAGGAAGEAAAQVAAGQPISGKDIAAEAIGELVTAPGEVVGNLREGARFRSEPQAARPQPRPTPAAESRPAEISLDSLRELQAALRSNQLRPEEPEPSSIARQPEPEPEAAAPIQEFQDEPEQAQPEVDSVDDIAEQVVRYRRKMGSGADSIPFIQEVFGLDSGKTKAVAAKVSELESIALPPKRQAQEPQEPAPTPPQSKPTAPTPEPAPKPTKPEPPQKDRVEQFLDSLKADVGPGSGNLQLFGLVPAAWNGLVETVRTAYRAGKSVSEAIDAGLAWLRQHHASAQLDELAIREHFTSRLLPYEDLKTRRGQITQRLTEIGGSKVAAPELRGERYKLAHESLSNQRELLKHPEYVADLIRQAEQAAQEMDAARESGDPDRARTAREKLEGITEGDLPRVNPDLYARVRKEMEDSGELRPDTTKAIGTGRTLAELVRWLNENKLDSPGIPLRERFSLGRRLADEWNSAKTAVIKAADRVSAAWKAFVDQFKNPASDTSVRALFKQWFYEKQVTGLETDRWVRAIEREIPRSERRAALSIWLQADGNRDMLQSQRDMVPDRYHRIWDTALNLTAKEQALGRRIMQDFEQKLEDAKSLGLIDKGREDYGVPQIWDRLPQGEGAYDPADNRKPRKPTARLDPRDPFFSLKRTVPSYFDGIMQGGVPKTLDIGKLVGIYNFEFHNVLADRGLIWQLRNAQMEDGSPAVKISGGATVLPRGEPGQRAFFVDSKKHDPSDVTKDGRPYRALDHWALRDWKIASTTESGNPVIVRGDFLIHPDIFNFIKNELGKSWLRDPEGGGKYFNPILTSAAFLKASKFASATFHTVTLAEHSMFHAISGRPTKERLALAWPSVRGVELDPDKNQDVAGLMRHGMETGFGSSRELFEEGLTSHGGIWAHVPGLGDLMSRMSTFLFKEYMPRLKVKTGLVALKSNRERYGSKLTDEQILELTASQMNAAFGAQNWRLLGTNKTLLDINRLMLTAPDFLLSRAKVVAQATKPYNAEQRYFLIAQAALLYVIARVLNQLLDGDPHWEPDQAFRVNYNGRSYAGRFIVQDIAHLLHEPVEFASGRLGPIPRSLIESITGRDMRTGAPKTVPLDVDNKALKSLQIFAKDLGEWLIPVGLEGFAPGSKAREQTAPGQVALALVGVGSRKRTEETIMRELARDFNAEHNVAPQPEFFGGDYSDLTRAIGNDDQSAARTALQELLKTKTRQQIATHYRSWPDSPYTGNRRREGAFLRSLTAEQRAAYLRSREKRRELARDAFRLLASVR